ncbi:alkene reductase [Mycolicibacterium sp. P1-18]|uniref:alkene reductase n=1 Tax=Mycolicibacterium sp. P1-18 TaxID=2024615 RepID=UPI0011F30492|nr:alkene reductase [Mycolicibacterium sp. P1-18]KAA0099635.1 alkene reductase [Mycolicibacterium sp. P1-18]
MTIAANPGQPLLTPYRMGDLDLANRVVMAPLTRSRATNPDLVPTELHVEYYAQRASAGLIVTEGIWVSREAVGWHDVPGLFTDEQVRAWSIVTDAVHQRGGVIIAQLWHAGAVSHPDFFDGVPPLGPSAINPEMRAPTSLRSKATVTPRAMTARDVNRTIGDFSTAAANAMRAGFDGVQLQAGYSYLISQFLNPATNDRTDAYGGGMANRARLLFDILDAVGARVDLGRVGVKAGPAWAESGRFQSTDDTLATAEYVANQLSAYPISHWMLMGAMADLTATPLRDLGGDGMFTHFRSRYSGTLMVNVDMTQARGNDLIDSGTADLVAFGQAFIANPDVPRRLAAGVPLTPPDPTTYYTPGAHGYTDYPVESSCGMPPHVSRRSATTSSRNSGTGV